MNEGGIEFQKKIEVCLEKVFRKGYEIIRYNIEYGEFCNSHERSLKR